MICRFSLGSIGMGIIINAGGCEFEYMKAHLSIIYGLERNYW